MKYRELICVAAIAMFTATGAFARVVNGNPNCVISTVGADTTFFSSPGEVLPDGFAVRLTNPQGSPLQGLKVEFFVNELLEFPEPPPDSPPLPPAEMYGHFDESYIVATTDAQGIARSGPFTAGTVSGTYEVAAPVFLFSDPENLAVCETVPGPQAYFEITQGFGSSAAALPATSLTSLFALVLLIAFVAAAHAYRKLKQRP
jgi:hypothetical protein